MGWVWDGCGRQGGGRETDMGGGNRSDEKGGEGRGEGGGEHGSAALHTFVVPHSMDDDQHERNQAGDEHGRHDSHVVQGEVGREVWVAVECREQLPRPRVACCVAVGEGEEESQADGRREGGGHARRNVQSK